jgi:peroxiredoxin family protein
MSTDTPTDAGSEAVETDDTGTEGASLEGVQRQIDELREDLAAVEDDVGDDRNQMTIIATKGTLDMAYPPLILASTAAAFGWDVTVFHTFWGLEILHEERSKDLQLSSVGNPNMPVPNVLAALPGMDRMTTWMMNRQIEDNDTATIEELIRTCLDMDVELQACQMTQELMDYDETEYYEGVTTGVGAATALEHMSDADIQLMI